MEGYRSNKGLHPAKAHQINRINVIKEGHIVQIPQSRIRINIKKQTKDRKITNPSM